LEKPLHIESVWQKWGIPHLSASSINTWIASPAKLIASKILKVEFPPGVAAMRGIAVEAGLVALAMEHDLPVDMAIRIASDVIAKEFQRHGIEPTDPAAQLELQRTGACIRMGADAVRQHGMPLTVQPTDNGAQQHRIEYDLGVGIPVIGFLDLKFLGGIVDIKSTSRLPSKMSAPHARQFSLYASATGMRTAGLYVSPNGVKLLEVLDIEVHLQTLRAAAHRLACFLSSFESTEHLVAACPPPDLSSFYWTSPKERSIAQTVFGIKS
jgi:hypothetical protein